MTATAPTPVIGRPLPRVDGRPKTTGTARYSADVSLPGLTHAVLVGAAIARGRITAIDAADALDAPGVLAVLTHENLPRVTAQPPLLPSLAGGPSPGQTFCPMQDDRIHYAGQHIAVVVADTYERALYAARLVHVRYREEDPVAVLDQGRDQAYVPEKIFGGLLPGRSARGDVEAGLERAEVRVEATYTFAPNHQNPLETSSTTAMWEGGRLFLHDATQGPAATQHTVSVMLGIPHADIRVYSHYVGGSFGAKASTWDHPLLAALAARHVGRPVRLALTREQMFTSCGHREEQEHRIALGADRDGRLTALRHHKLSLTSHFDDWAETSLEAPAQVYACPAHEGVYRLVRGNTMTPTFMRCPGEGSGMFALESALDELATRLDIDPLELRLRNHADRDPASGKPWSSHGLRECYERGAERIGWDRRVAGRPEREGPWTIGLGMASAVYPIVPPSNPQRARARIYADGSAVAQAATAEFGTGAATAMAQVLADALGLPVERCRFEGGDTDLPNVASTVGSTGAAMVGSAVHLAAVALRDQLIGRAVADERSPLHGADPGAVVPVDGRMALRDDPGTGESYAELLTRHFQPDAEAYGSFGPPQGEPPAAMITLGAHFVEVAVDGELGRVRVRRMAGAFAPGRVLNARTAKGQLMSGMLWGMSQALLEATHMDAATGRWANPSLGDYLIPVHADTPEVTVDLIETADHVVNPLGVKGVGEIGQSGTAAAIANAIHHATGRRIRKLPMTVEDTL
ncbi:xanthine dehydrogenase family protein molybdopterin-binding subunit [Streptomyces radicis]|uniref:Xanthine dehydrogenase family protein molybdopterin-binding subunit n=1 Tax=Streptomyces radicis TaxID=1750517 RepID=A0A3A9WDS7_9ACTN|nr:xanthine dehydrogenase family protein molybdopterin-binding subunit [Streptomyces radicis]RKN07554.1 xanthine dehydrogenase family protein molybdopterin-binding subunit [Streptomyces radicis]RKN13685.1 xanthine dehydrogenase family protein molybdopterin-binding subunit [Streptomyces radicis]